MIHYVLATANSFPTCCSFCGRYEPIISDNVGNSPFMRIHQEIIIPLEAMYCFLNRIGRYGFKNIFLLSVASFLRGKGREEGAGGLPPHSPESLLTSCLAQDTVDEGVVQDRAFYTTPSHRLGQGGQEPESANTRAEALPLNSSLGSYI